MTDTEKLMDNLIRTALRPVKHVLTIESARAAAMDAANKQMRNAGRTAWDEDDFNLASKVLSDLTDDDMFGEG